MIYNVALPSCPSYVFDKPKPVMFTDYLEMSAAWDEPIFAKYRQREMYRKVYPMTVLNTSHYQLKRVRFGRDPSLKPDRWRRRDHVNTFFLCSKQLIGDLNLLYFFFCEMFIFFIIFSISIFSMLLLQNYILFISDQLIYEFFILSIVIVRIRYFV